MEKELKDKVLKLYLNKIKKDDFEKELYELVVSNNLKKDTLFYDLVILNYKDVNYRNTLFKLLKEHCSKIELLTLEVYENCMSIIESNDQKEILSIIDYLARLYYESDYIYDVLFSFYRLYDQISIKKDGFYLISDKEIVLEAKELSIDLSKEIEKRYNEFSTDENWCDFLEKSSIEIENNTIEKPIKKEIYLNKEVSNKWFEFWKN